VWPLFPDLDHALSNNRPGRGQGNGIPMDNLDPNAPAADVHVSVKLSKLPAEVECYASTYPSNNGEAHLYQEVNHHASKAGPPPMPSGSVPRMGSLDRKNFRPGPSDHQFPASRIRGHTLSLSREAVGPKPHEPLRNALSFSSRFSETNIPAASRTPPLPQAQPPPYSEVVKMPRQQQQHQQQYPHPVVPYLEARPSGASMVSLPAMRPRPLNSTSSRFMTSLQSIPDEMTTVSNTVDST